MMMMIMIIIIIITIIINIPTLVVKWLFSFIISIY